MVKNISWIYFVRHAESEGNASKDYSGHPREISLTKKGEGQAKVVSKLLKKERFDLIVVSSYKRARQTAVPLIKSNGVKIKVKTWPVQEFTYHSLSKYLNIKQSARFKLAHQYWVKSDPDYRDGPGAETYREFIKRIDSVHRRLEKNKFNKALVVSHGHFIRHFIWRLLHADWEINQKSMTLAGNFGWGIDAKNTAVIKIAKIGGKLYVGEINSRHVKSS